MGEKKKIMLAEQQHTIFFRKEIVLNDREWIREENKIYTYTVLKFFVQH